LLPTAVSRPTECLSIESLRRYKGSETADVTAEAYALRKAYSDVQDVMLAIKAFERFFENAQQVKAAGLA
jgi:hypothetical protein